MKDPKLKQDPVFSNLQEIRIGHAGKKPSKQDPAIVQETDASRLQTSSERTTASDSALTDNVSSSEVAISIPDTLDIPFVYVPPGIFTMGSPLHEPGRGNDETEREVTLTRGFYMSVIPVTQRQWKAVMGSNPSCFQDHDDLPVESVTWHQCQEFLRKLNRAGNETYRLPTEAEWEYACRAKSLTAFADGEISELFCAHDPILDEMGWYCGNSGRKSHALRKKNPNAWGLHDMHGNVGEWCQDWYGEYSIEITTDPMGPPSGPGKVVRGGSWFSNAKNCRSACRFYWRPNTSTDLIGFRLLREPK